MLKFYLTVNGRISRKATWLAVLVPFMVIGIGADQLDAYLFDGERKYGFADVDYGPFGLIVTIALLWPGFATSIRRFHDLNMTGWWAAFAIPLVLWMPEFADSAEIFRNGGIELALAIVWVVSFLIAGLLGLAQLFVPGTHGDNRFGPDPLWRD